MFRKTSKNYETLLNLLFTLFKHNFRAKNQYIRLFIRKLQVHGSNESKIVINKNNGDTTFQAYYTSRDIVNNSQQEFIKTYKGTPFFKNGWYKGKISNENGKDLEFLMAFNLQKNELYVVENPEKDALTIKPEAFTIAGHHFSQFEKTFYEIIYSSKNIVLKEHSCVLSANGSVEKSGYEVSGGVGEYEGEFVKSSKYFVLKDENPFLLPKGKQFLKLFGDKKDKVEAYVKANNINLKSENGIINIFKYFDSLDFPQ